MVSLKLNPTCKTWFPSTCNTRRRERTTKSTVMRRSLLRRRRCKSLLVPMLPLLPPQLPFASVLRTPPPQRLEGRLGFAKGLSYSPHLYIPLSFLPHPDVKFSDVSYMRRCAAYFDILSVVGLYSSMQLMRPGRCNNDIFITTRNPSRWVQRLYKYLWYSQHLAIANNNLFDLNNICHLRNSNRYFSHRHPSPTQCSHEPATRSLPYVSFAAMNGLVSRGNEFLCSLSHNNTKEHSLFHFVPASIGSQYRTAEVKSFIGT